MTNRRRGEPIRFVDWVLPGRRPARCRDVQHRPGRGSDRSADLRGVSPPVPTFLVCAVTLEVSLATIFSPALMDLFVRDLPQLRAGQ